MTHKLVSEVDLEMAIDGAVARLASATDVDPVGEYLIATAPTRPAPTAPGTLGEQLGAVTLYHGLPAYVRRTHRERAWEGVCDRALSHRRPVEDQVAGLAGAPAPDAAVPEGIIVNRRKSTRRRSAR